jgi:hypothetical protein
MVVSYWFSGGLSSKFLRNQQSQLFSVSVCVHQKH